MKPNKTTTTMKLTLVFITCKIALLLNSKRDQFEIKLQVSFLLSDCQHFYSASGK